MRFPITTGPEGIVRTTWKLTALANVGTRTTQPAITGTPTRSSSIRSGAMIAGAAPTHKWRQANSHRLLVLDRSDRHLLLQSRAAIAAARAIDLDHAFETVVGNLGAPHTDQCRR